jgi:hypothetical protein
MEVATVTNNGLRTSSVVLALVCVSWHANAGAENRDHLRCYRTQDAAGAVVAADLESVPFGIEEGCTVETKVRELCVPATGDVIADADSNEAGIEGDDLAEERLCYQLDCPRRDRAVLRVTDRFGARLVSARRSKLVCLPVARQDAESD